MNPDKSGPHDPSFVRRNSLTRASPAKIMCSVSLRVTEGPPLSRLWMSSTFIERLLLVSDLLVMSRGNVALIG